MNEAEFKNNDYPKTIGQLREMISSYSDSTLINDISVDGNYYDYHEIEIKPWGNGVSIIISGGWD